MTDTTKITLGVVGGVAVLAVLYLALRPATPTLLNDGSRFSQDTPLTQQETSDGSVVGGIARAVGDITRTIVGQVENDRARAERERREAAERAEREAERREAAEERQRDRENANRNTSGRDRANLMSDYV